MKSLILSSLAAIAAAQEDLTFTSQDHFKLKHPAFINLGKFNDSEDFLLVSSFKAMGNGDIYIVPNVKEAVKAGDVSQLDPVKLKTHQSF